jgi:hypothetical protein
MGEPFAPYEYESEGFDLDGLWYLPDFYFPAMRMWGEVKPIKPTGLELEKIARLEKYSGRPVLLFIGQPTEDYPLTMYVAEAGMYLRMRPGIGSQHNNALLKARQARFEHGETPQAEISKPSVVAQPRIAHPPNLRLVPTCDYPYEKCNKPVPDGYGYQIGGGRSVCFMHRLAFGDRLAARPQSMSLKERWRQSLYDH